MATEHMDFTTCPVTGWDIGPVHERDAIALRIKYLDVGTQQQAETPFFEVPRVEARNLIDSLSQAISRLEASVGGS